MCKLISYCFDTEAILMAYLRSWVGLRPAAGWSSWIRLWKIVHRSQARKPFVVTEPPRSQFARFPVGCDLSVLVNTCRARRRLYRPKQLTQCSVQWHHLSRPTGTWHWTVDHNQSLCAYSESTSTLYDAILQLRVVVVWRWIVGYSRAESARITTPSC